MAASCRHTPWEGKTPLVGGPPRLEPPWGTLVGAKAPGSICGPHGALVWLTAGDKASRSSSMKSPVTPEVIHPSDSSPAHKRGAGVVRGSPADATGTHRANWEHQQGWKDGEADEEQC